MSVIKIPTVFNIDLEYQVADFGRRLMAYLIDLAIRIAWIILMIYVIDKYITVEDRGEGIFYFVFVLLPIAFYYLISEVIMSGQSLGKKVMAIKVVSMAGSTPSTSQTLLRWMFRLVESPLLSLMLLFAAAEDESVFGVLFSLAIAIFPLVIVLRSPLSQRLGDITAGTIVIRSKEKTTIHDTIFREIAATDYVPQFSQVLRLSDRDLGKIKSVLDNSYRTKNPHLAFRVADRVKQVLQIQTDMEPTQFLETLLNDYNYLVQRG